MSVCLCVCVCITKLLQDCWGIWAEIWCEDASNTRECCYLYFMTLTSRSRSQRGRKSNFTFIAISQPILKLQLKCKNWQIAYVFGYLNKILPKLPHFRFENSPGTQNFDSVNSVRGYPCDISWTTQRIWLRIISHATLDMYYKRLNFRETRIKAKVTARSMVKLALLQYLAKFFSGSDGSRQWLSHSSCIYLPSWAVTDRICLRSISNHYYVSLFFEIIIDLFIAPVSNLLYVLYNLFF